MTVAARVPGRGYLLPAVVIAAILLVAMGAGLYLSDSQGTATSTPGPVRVVAAENFWGNLAAQLGGSKVSVSSVVTDPNVDPHAYLATSSDAREISDAQLVIVNGAGYDTWALNVIAAGGGHNQKVLNVQQIAGLPLDANPHLWYSPYFVNETVRAIYNDLVAIDPADGQYFHDQYLALNVSLWQGYMSLEAQIRAEHSGAPIAATEDVFTYMANATGLRLVSPPAFMQAVAQGTDPAAQDVAAFQQLLEGGRSAASVLVYNRQTITPLTDSMRSLAIQNQIPVVPVTETMPLNTTFQAWMGSELSALQSALAS